jgi:hypothetical protein
LLTETGNEKENKRYIFLKQLYNGTTLEDAAVYVGMS